MQKVVLFLNVTLSCEDTGQTIVPHIAQSTQLSFENSASLDLSYGYLADGFYHDTCVVTEQSGSPALFIS